MNGIPFEKWHGLGNDFILIRAEALHVTPELAQRLCDRRHGIGADGVLLLDVDPPRMTILNADGSRPEMCGNGLRCAASYFVSKGIGGFPAISVQTDAGAKRCEVRPLGEGRWGVTVDMGKALRAEPIQHSLAGRRIIFDAINIGNPHAITFEPVAQEAIDLWGPAVEKIPAGGTNVEFCRSSPSGIDVVVWERGVGRTLACGTGACAVLAVACDRGLASLGEFVRVGLPGGDLLVRMDESTRECTMQGPAASVFSGIFSMSQGGQTVD